MFPKAFVDRIQQQFVNADEFLDALTNPSYTSVRLHPVKRETSLDLKENISWCPNGYYLPERPKFTLDPLFHAGTYYVQESSSMFLWYILESLFNTKEVQVLDLCAAPGGKSTLISSWLNGNGLLLSNEVIKTRANILLENIIKWGYSNNWVTSTDARVLGGLSEFFDCIVLDAPCSGEGLFRKDKTSVDEWSESNCDLCAGRQRKIAAEILPSLREDGYLIYSTCTFNPGENDENIKWMLHEFPLEIVELNISEFPDLCKTEMGGLAFYPHLTKGEGFYCCVLRKIGQVDESKNIRRQKITFPKLDIKGIDLNNFVKDLNKFHLTTVHQKLAGIPTNLKNQFEEISSITKILGGYLNIGEIKGKDLIPDHALAMNLDLNQPFPKVELNRENALCYLARQEFNMQIASFGWTIFTHQSIPLGFAKVLSNRINNYYPQEWRIRMNVI